MATVDFMHICDHAFQTERHQPCIIGINPIFIVNEFPYRRAVVTVAAMISREPSQPIDIGIEFGPENGPPLRSARLQMDPMPGPRIFLPTQLTLVVFKTPGKYVARIKDGGTIIGEASVMVVKVGSPGAVWVGAAAGVIGPQPPR